MHISRKLSQTVVRVLLPKGEGGARSATDEGLRCWAICACGLCASHLGVVAPHPPLRGTFSQWEKDAPRELRQSQTVLLILKIAVGCGDFAYAANLVRESALAWRPAMSAAMVARPSAVR